MTTGISVFMMTPDVFMGYIVLGSGLGYLLGRSLWEMIAYSFREQEKRFNGTDDDGPDLPKNPNASA